MTFWGEDVSSLLVRQEKEKKSDWKGKTGTENENLNSHLGFSSCLPLALSPVQTTNTAPSSATECVVSYLSDFLFPQFRSPYLLSHNSLS